MDSREISRTKLFIVVLALDAFLISLIMLNYPADTRPLGYWLSLSFGAMFGILTCLYLRIVWDPHSLELKDPNARTADPRWMPIVVIGGIIFARLVLGSLDTEITIAFVNIGFAWVIITLGYIGFLALWHRP